VKYSNPWHRPGLAHYGPAFYETDAKPVPWAGCLIYERVPGLVWDVVKDGVCVAQHAGLRGARDAADARREAA
jgi:hypothetical protein